MLRQWGWILLVKLTGSNLCRIVIKLISTLAVIHELWVGRCFENTVINN